MDASPKTFVCLDFGHGGKDSGAFQNGIREKDVNLAYGQRIGANLSGLGYDLMYTRVGNGFLGISKRGWMWLDVLAFCGICWAMIYFSGRAIMRCF